MGSRGPLGLLVSEWPLCFHFKCVLHVDVDRACSSGSSRAKSVGTTTVECSIRTSVRSMTMPECWQARHAYIKKGVLSFSLSLQRLSRSHPLWQDLFVSDAPGKPLLFSSSSSSCAIIPTSSSFVLSLFFRRLS